MRPQSGSYRVGDTIHPMFRLAVTLAQNQPDLIDWAAMLIYLVLAFGVPAIGYWLMIVDIRAYLRALRGVIAVVSKRLPHGAPAWVRRHTPGCFRALGVEATCTEEEVKRAYRRLAESMHPDRGGDRQQFHVLQRQFEEALDYVRETETMRTPEFVERFAISLEGRAGFLRREHLWG